MRTMWSPSWTIYDCGKFISMVNLKFRITVLAFIHLLYAHSLFVKYAKRTTKNVWWNVGYEYIILNWKAEKDLRRCVVTYYKQRMIHTSQNAIIGMFFFSLETQEWELVLGIERHWTGYFRICFSQPKLNFQCGGFSLRKETVHFIYSKGYGISGNVQTLTEISSSKAGIM